MISMRSAVADDRPFGDLTIKDRCPWRARCLRTNCDQLADDSVADAKVGKRQEGRECRERRKEAVGRGARPLIATGVTTSDNNRPSPRPALPVMPPRRHAAIAGFPLHAPPAKPIRYVHDALARS